MVEALWVFLEVACGCIGCCGPGGVVEQGSSVLSVWSAENPRPPVKFPDRIQSSVRTSEPTLVCFRLKPVCVWAHHYVFSVSIPLGARRAKWRWGRLLGNKTDLPMPGVESSAAFDPASSHIMTPLISAVYLCP